MKCKSTLLGCFERDFLKETSRVAFPVALQYLITNLLNMMDTIMIGNLGEAPLSGVNAANQIFFIINLFLFGFASAGSIFAAQYYGAGNKKKTQHIVGISVLMAVGVALLGSILVFTMPEKLIGIFSKDAEVINYGTKYLNIVVWSYIPTAITIEYYGILKGANHVKLPLYISSVALVINTVLNYLLINGLYGFPKLGVEGAAIATLVARIVELATMFIYIYAKKYTIATSFKNLFSFKWGFYRHYMLTSLPLIANEGLWGMAFSMYTVVYGRMGTMQLAAYTIAGNVDRIFTFVFFGIAQAAMVIVGHKLGAGKKEEAYDYSKKIITLGTILGVIFGILLIVSLPLIMALYNVTPQTKDMAVAICVAIGVILPIRMFNFVNIVGVVRSGGKTLFAAIMDVGFIWLMGVPMAIIGGLIWKLPVQYVYLLSASEEIFKLVIGLWWLKSKRWIGVVVERKD